MIEVLWIDDECKDSSGKLTATALNIINMAFEHDIKITPVLTYKEGIDMIDNNHLQWCAVILDIYNQKATREKPSDDYDEAREQIIRIQTKYGQQEPYIFVLSGNEKYKECPIRRPNYCQKNIYDKSGQDYELLFTIKQADYEKIKDSIEVHVIGHITEANMGMMLVTPQNTTIQLRAQGWSEQDEE